MARKSGIPICDYSVFSEEFVRALLLNPNYGETFWSFKYALRIVYKRAVMPPLGLLTVAALLPKEWEKRLVDLNARKLKDSDLHWAEIVFISAYQVQEPSAREVIRRCRSAGLKIVAGGPLFLLDHDDFPEVDHFVLREAEITLPEFLEDLAAGKNRRIYTTEQWAEVEKSPIPLWEIVARNDYFMLNLQFSRGCPHQCEFCGIAFLDGRRLRTKNKDQILAELEQFHAAGWRQQVMFVDDNFIGHRKRLKQEILPAMIAWMRGKKYPFTFLTQASLDLADDQELMDLMVQAGFTIVFVGIESTHDASLKECSKNQNRNRDLLASVQKIQKSGLQVQGGFVVGFDNDPCDIFEKQEAFVQASGIATAMMNLLKPVPGTRLFERLEKEGRLRPHSFQGDYTAGVVNFVPKTMTAGDLLEKFKTMIAKLYSPAAYYARLKTFFKNYSHLTPAGNPPLQWMTLVSFFRAILVLGIFNRGRIYDWRFLTWCLVKYPRRFKLAMTLIVFGWNYRKYYEKEYGLRIR
jgi:radical SAM superfamily enzyme YgiQ (UPF0313 family)